eukprot:g3469.t1
MENVSEEKDLLYDSKLDTKDARWVHGIRGGRNSDAILSCPCCFTTLCVDCQQHSTNPNRYRAMFVMNSRVDLQQKRYPYRSTTSEGKRKSVISILNDDEECCAVFCGVCGLEVAVYDNEGVYHFFNMLPSTA